MKQIDEMQRVPHVQCEFYEDRSIVDQKATELAGHPVYKVKDRVRMAKIGGNGQIADEFVSWVKTHVELWPAIEPQYKAWKAGQAAPVNGMPIEMWPACSAQMAKVLRMAHVRSVEEVAELQDNQLQNIGMGSRELRDKAIRWLQTSRDVGRTTEALAARDAEVASLKEQMAEMMAMMKVQAINQPAPRKRGRPPRSRSQESETRIHDDPDSFLAPGA